MIIVDTGFWLALANQDDAEYLGHGRIFTCDRRNFLTYRWNNTHIFENLFLD
jgi:predicted nucleic acid-binding protein